MRQIPLTQGKVARVSDIDYRWLSQWKWCYHHSGYARRQSNRREVQMHRAILTHKGIRLGTRDVDHRDENKLNNTRRNLRTCTRSQNKANVFRQRGNTTGFKGVTFHKKSQKFQAQLTTKGRCIYLGQFTSKIEAAAAYNKAARKLFGRFASLNRVPAR